MTANSKRAEQKAITYLWIFFGGALLYLAAVLPFLAGHDGIFFYYGDYNVQQVPFYILAHRAVREGRFFWTPYIDLGSSMGGSMSFYLWGSPFFWLTIPFSEKLVPYLMPFLMALRCGTAMVTSYAYIRRHVRGRSYALMGALLYTFSGFQAVNIVFQHFHDVTAFFPLFLISFDELVQRKRYTGFTLMTALMSIINYYFFFGEVVFIILYYFMRYAPRRKPRGCAQEIGRILLAGIPGLMLASFFLVQSLGGVSGNSRLDDLISGYGLLTFEDPATPFAVVKSMFMVPDIVAKPTLFAGENIKNSPPAAYLPCFSLAGVIAYIRTGRRQWKSRLVLSCALASLLPVFNSAFSAFNQEYYSRWFFMPLLVMSCMTVQVLERGDRRGLRFGAAVCIMAAALITIFAAWPFKVNGVRQWFGLTDNPDLLKTEIASTAAQLAVLIVLVYILPVLRPGAAVKKIFWGAAVIICCYVTTTAVLCNGDSLIAGTGCVKWRQQMLETRPELAQTEEFFRVETESTSTNYEMVWGYPTIHCFESTVHPSIFSFYRQIGMIRSVESTLPVERVGARALLSARYYIENKLVKPKETIEEKGGLAGYEETGENNGYRIFENRNFIPMGFTFDLYMTQDNYDSLSERETADRLLVQDLILTKEQRMKYGDLMQEDRDIVQDTMSENKFEDLCRRRASSACPEFAFTRSGFTALADLPAENLVFFSVPYDEGFTAAVDGRETVIEKVDGGLMAIPVPAGQHRIEVVYYPAGLRAAKVISAATAGMLLLAAVFLQKPKFVRHRNTNVLAKRKEP